MNSYQKWLSGDGCSCANNFIHIETADCKKQDVCDCENILLELSKQHTDDLTLQDEIDYVSGITDTKLDESAYTPTDLSDYYTKEEVDELIQSGSSGCCITPEEVDNKIASAKTEIESEIPSLSGYATEQWVENKHYITGVDLSDYATHQWVENKGYLTEHQPLKTINGYTISGTGNIEITASGGSISVDSELSSTSTNPVENRVIYGALNNKLDTSAYTPTEQVQSDWNVTDSASTAYIKNKPTIPIVPTNVSAFNNDAGYLTEHQSLSGYATTGYVETALSGKQDTLSAGTGINITNNVLSTKTGNGLRYTQDGTLEVNSTNAIASGNTQVPLSYVVYTYVNNNCMMKSQIWCGTQAEYDLISPKQNDVLYLIHE